MSIFISAIRLDSNYDDVSKITDFMYVDDNNIQYGPYTKQYLCNYLDANSSIKAYVNIPTYPEVEVVHDRYKGEYLRSEANDTTKDNLLKLPRF